MTDSHDEKEQKEEDGVEYVISDPKGVRNTQIEPAPGSNVPIPPLEEILNYRKKEKKDEDKEESES